MDVSINNIWSFQNSILWEEYESNNKLQLPKGAEEKDFFFLF